MKADEEKENKKQGIENEILDVNNTTIENTIE